MADIDFEAAEEDMMDDVHVAEPAPAPAAPRLRSTVGAVKQKGRGFRESDAEARAQMEKYDTLPGDKGPGPAKSVEGWVVFITGVHEEAQEEDVINSFSDFGHVKNCYLNLDRRTGFVKGYALVEFATRKEAQEAINGMNGQELLTQPVQVTWAFGNGPCRKMRKK